MKKNKKKAIKKAKALALVGLYKSLFTGDITIEQPANPLSEAIDRIEYINTIQHELHDVKEALDRRRQLYASMEEYMNRKHTKSIDAMAESLYDLLMPEHGVGEWLEFSELNESEKDLYRQKLMYVLDA